MGVKLLCSVFMLLVANVAFAQIAPETVGKEETAAVAWKTIKPEKLEAKHLRILPSNRLLRLQLDDDMGFTKVVIQDLNGNTLIESPYAAGSDLDISTLKPGNYFIKVISANRVLQGKFGKRRL
ncbi:T9SS type A sorting domain-containing protein [Robertkochia sediminum]|uniref:T9SS type A sorting domain-containing protein n=1 Tax=Robertkochia sediminum TaxID=2785326 RepID=UPI00193469F1|nr:T9SS type A sorting domain-containing protein [Robertkochia sediminum]MBL7473137.1 T9SS type A sorting domain-containing protein [Robertkochia sediminum]